MGRAASEIITADLTQTGEISIIPSESLHRASALLGIRPVNAPGISAERSEAQLAGATQIVYGQIASLGGKLRLQASIEDAATQRIVRTVTSTADSVNGLLAAADRIAQEISRGAQPFSTRNQDAIEAYARGIEAPAAQADAYFEHAARADPNFGAAWVARARIAAARRDRAAFDEIVAQAGSRGAALPPIDRAYLQYEAAAVRGDLPSRLEAMEAITRLTPADAVNLRTLAEAEMNARRFGPAIEHFRRLVALAPGDIESWNLLGYTLAFSGDYSGAVTALNEYQRLRPQEANPLDSLGDVNFYFDKLSEAENDYLKAQEKDPNFQDSGELLKAAQARLMTGDVTRADQIFARYREARQAARDPFLEFRQAEWLYLTGRRTEGMEAVRQFISNSPAPQLKAPGLAQLGLWKLDAGGRMEARKLSQDALRVLRPQAALQAALVWFLSQDAAPVEEWKARAERVFGGANNSALRRLVVAEALLFSRQFPEARPLWKEVYEQSGPMDQTAQILYAWTLIETGSVSEAASVLRYNPIPQPNAAGAVTTLWFPRIFSLRATAAKLQGRTDEAQRNLKIFSALSPAR